MRNVLIGYDDSQPSKRALQYVIERARDIVEPIQVPIINA